MLNRILNRVTFAYIISIIFAAAAEPGASVGWLIIAELWSKNE